MPVRARMSVAMIDEVTMAAETRAFGSRKMSPIYVWHIPMGEWVVMGLSAILLVGMLISTFVYHIGLA
jgi:energy-coupling factor transporter transmembrane protein EcfT